MKTAALIFVLFFYASLNAQPYWIPISSPTQNLINALHFEDSLKGWIAGDNSDLFYTSNGGVSWVDRSPTNLNYKFNEVTFLNDNTGWIVALKLFTDANGEFGSYIFRTTNAGASWDSVYYPTENAYLHVLHFFDLNTGWAIGEPGVIARTTNSGNSFALANIDTAFYSRAPAFNINFFSPSFGIACGGYIDITAVVWRTINGGNSWTPFSVGPEPIHSIHFFDSLNILGMGGDFEYGATVIRSTDAGSNWTYESLNEFGIAQSLSFRTETEGWATLTIGAKFARTTNSGANWTFIPTPGNRLIYDLQFTDRRNGYATGDSGRIYKFNSILSIDPISSIIPNKYMLYQNIPNPFNPISVIKFDISSAGNVLLQVFNSQGKLVSEVINSTLKQGSYSIQFNGNLLPSGIYYYRLKSGNFSHTKKMILLK